MSDNVRLRFTITGEYDADPDDYGTSDPTEMAEIDMEHLNINDLVESNLNPNGPTIEIEPVRS